MAETIGFYVMYPDKILSCCPEKFAFVRDRIMSGYRYVTMLREPLTRTISEFYEQYDGWEFLPSRTPYRPRDVSGAPE